MGETWDSKLFPGGSENDVTIRLLETVKKAQKIATDGKEDTAMLGIVSLVMCYLEEGDASMGTMLAQLHEAQHDDTKAVEECRR